MFSKILIANRGEIAVRIIRACKEMGIATVAVYSEADREALHVDLADEAYCIGAAQVKDSYLNQAALVTLAKYTGSEAIHPGYGLLSENAEFAAACRASGIVFIGPDADVISKMGDKEAAKKTMKASGIPIIEGTNALKSISAARNAADKIGYPVLLKARSGGGGRGIRIVNSADEIEKAYTSATSEAKAAFGDDTVYMEKYLTNVKHIEVQIIRDFEGKTVVLGERDCSVQRKNQKLIEECPAPSLSSEVRKELYAAAVKAANAVNYTTVGTIEFLVDGSNFYFMEMNTRLQVEHSVTEMACGIDIVKWQIRTAAGMSLRFDKSDCTEDVYAIECRICAEDPKTFHPGCGTINILHIPGGPGVRFDSHIYQNYTIPPYYDSLLGKLIVSSKTREQAIRKMRAALAELIIEGVVNNSSLFLELLSLPDFESGNYTTDLLSSKNA